MRPLLLLGLLLSSQAGAAGLEAKVTWVLDFEERWTPRQGPDVKADTATQQLSKALVDSGELVKRKVAPTAGPHRFVRGHVVLRDERPVKSVDKNGKEFELLPDYFAASGEYSLRVETPDGALVRSIDGALGMKDLKGVPGISPFQSYEVTRTGLASILAARVVKLLKELPAEETGSTVRNRLALSTKVDAPEGFAAPELFPVLSAPLVARGFVVEPGADAGCAILAELGVKAAPKPKGKAPKVPAYTASLMLLLPDGSNARLFELGAPDGGVKLEAAEVGPALSDRVAKFADAVELAVKPSCLPYREPPTLVLQFDEQIFGWKGGSRTAAIFGPMLAKEAQESGFKVSSKPVKGGVVMRGQVFLKEQPPNVMLSGPGEQNFFPATGELSLTVEDETGAQRGVISAKLGMNMLRGRLGFSSVISYERTMYDLVRIAAPTLMARALALAGPAPNPKPTVLVLVEDRGSSSLQDEIQRAVEGKGAVVLSTHFLDVLPDGRPDTGFATCVVSGKAKQDFDRTTSKASLEWDLEVRDLQKEAIAGEWASDDLKRMSPAQVSAKARAEAITPMLERVLASMPSCVASRK